MPDNNDNHHPTSMTTSCRILYSTQSGRARACARRTARLVAPFVSSHHGVGTTFDDDIGTSIVDWANRLRQEVTATKSVPQDDKQPKQLLLLLFVSTTGDGEHTDTIQRTWKHLLQKSLPNDLFRGISFAIFCLGDRAYGPTKFCAAGRKLLIRLRQLGMTMNVDPGYGDDGTPNGGVFADLDHWLQTKLLPRLQQQCSGTTTASPTIAKSPPYIVTVSSKINNSTSNIYFPEWQLEDYVDSYNRFFQSQCPLSAYHYDSENGHNSRRLVPTESGSVNKTKSFPLRAHVLENRRITCVDWEQNTRHIHLEVTMTTNFGTVAQTNPDEQSLNEPPSLLLSAAEKWSVDSLPYRAGDVAVIMPSNSLQEVEAFLQVLPPSLRAMADQNLSIHYADAVTNHDGGEVHYPFPGIGYAHWPHLCTLRGWLTHCADVHALPEREDLRALALYCSTSSILGKEQQKKLVSLSETKDSALYVDYILREKRSWVDVLYDFDSLRDDSESKLTIAALLGLLPPIRPRDFSIASSPTRDWLTKRESKGQSTIGADSQFGVELCVAVVEGVTRRGRAYHGLCSNFLAQLSPSPIAVFPLWIRPGSFHGLPLECVTKDESTQLQVPILCVGAGTGIAPLRALLHERDAVHSIHCSTRKQNNATHENGLDRANTLVFGCRMKTADYYYEEEWNEMRKGNRLAVLVAFSRDQKYKVYVQQLLGDSLHFGREKIVRHVLDRKGAIFIAGGPKMARAVKELIVDAFTSEISFSDSETQSLLSKLQRRGLYSVEVWN